MKFYFAGAIRGGRDKVSDYQKIIERLEKYGEVLDKHVSDINLSNDGEKISDEIIYERDINWINQCDMLFAEVTQPSLGVGYEIRYAENKGKKIVCMCESSKKVSAMIMGNNNIMKISYNNIDELLNKIDEIIK